MDQSTTASANADPGTTSVPELMFTSAPRDRRFHNYVGHDIPWYVRLIWIAFWCYSAWYVIRWLLPALDTELLSPP
ncbi:MAG: hypothetical protein SFX72_09105 [Isosphaeraceae bacterium]|nr:hypothetical protein [Isosphaeraceae bacterium]